MLNYKVLVTDEAINDIIELVRYIAEDLFNPEAAERLLHNLKREVENCGAFPMKFSDTGIKYRDYIIHKKVFESYLIFYVINSGSQEVYVLRVMKDLMNWCQILRTTEKYHF